MISQLARLKEGRELVEVFYLPTKDPEGRDWYCYEKGTWYNHNQLEFIDNTEEIKKKRTIWQSDSIPTLRRILEILWDEGDIEVVSGIPTIIEKLRNRIL